jgi:hypothetical protein
LDEGIEDVGGVGALALPIPVNASEKKTLSLQHVTSASPQEKRL